MAKKCIPGVMCVENLTLFLIIFILILSAYVLYALNKDTTSRNTGTNTSIRVAGLAPVLDTPMIAGISTRNAPNVILDPLGPPLRNDGVYFPRDSAEYRGIPIVSNPMIVNPFVSSGPIVSTSPLIATSQVKVGVPINIETRGLGFDYTQIGILTRQVDKGDDLILPLMGRKLQSGVDKWQYYTTSNTGTMPTKLPIKVKGRDCSGEYGCDCVYNGDPVHVSGYNDTFKVQTYENSKFTYIPYV